MTSTGYLKSGWSILTGNELYIYYNKDALEHSEMLIISGGKLIATDKPVEFPNSSYR